MQTVLHHVRERRRNGRWQVARDRLLAEGRGALRQRFDERDAEAPDIARRSETCTACFRRIVHGGLCDADPRCTGGKDAITRQFQLIGDDQEVLRLQVSVHETFAVQEAQGGQDRRKQFDDFLRSQGPLAQDFRKALLRMLHHDEQELMAAELAQTGVEELNEVGVGQPGCQLPVRQLRQGNPLYGDDFYRGSGIGPSLTLGEENSAVLRAAQEAAQRVCAIDIDVELRGPIRGGRSVDVWLRTHETQPVEPKLELQVIRRAYD